MFVRRLLRVALSLTMGSGVAAAPPNIVFIMIDDLGVGWVDAYGQPNSWFDPYSNGTIEDRKEGEYLTDRLGDEAAAFIKEHRDQPFQLTFWPYTVHTPIKAPADLVEKHDGDAFLAGTQPLLVNGDAPDDFDSHLVDDACLVVRDGRYWLYYKGRQLGASPSQTQMGLAIADQPRGPYVKHAGNPVIPGNHEVLVWPQGSGVAALIGTRGPQGITRSILYAEDGIQFDKIHDVLNVPHAAGAYRPEAFVENGRGAMIEWGLQIGKKKDFLPFIQRIEFREIEGDPQ